MKKVRGSYTAEAAISFPVIIIAVLLMGIVFITIGKANNVDTQLVVSASSIASRFAILSECNVSQSFANAADGDGYISDDTHTYFYRLLYPETGMAYVGYAGCAPVMDYQVKDYLTDNKALFVGSIGTITSQKCDALIREAYKRNVSYGLNDDIKQYADIDYSNVHYECSNGMIVIHFDVAYMIRFPFKLWGFEGVRLKKNMIFKERI